MKTFVLVHGSHMGGWVWKRVAAILQAQGHSVYTPTLTGLSDRAHLLNCDVNLTTHITDIARLIEYEDLENVILVGNSYGGMVITGAANTAPDRLKLLIYLDAYLPDDGQSEEDLWPAQLKAAIEADPAFKSGFRSPPRPEALGITDRTLVNWVNARWTMQPMATYTEKVPAGSHLSRMISGAYIHCISSPDFTTPIFSQSAARARMRGWPVIEMAAEHAAMLTSPQETAEQLLELSYTH